VEALVFGRYFRLAPNVARLDRQHVALELRVFATIMGGLTDLAELRITSDVPTEITNYPKASKPIAQLT